jgi:hypothetical protein
MTVPTIKGLPTLHWLNDLPGDAVLNENGVLTMSAKENSDWFNAPIAPSSPALPNAPALVFVPPACDWQLAAKVSAKHELTFDAGAIFLHQGKDDWCKYCFELPPEKKPLVVSVVTRGVSDDANGATVEDDFVHLRVSKLGPVIALHYSTDNRAYWTLHRIFTMREPDAPMSVGFLVQHPLGGSCTAAFSQIELSEKTLADPRDGK